MPPAPGAGPKLEPSESQGPPKEEGNQPVAPHCGSVNHLMLGRNSSRIDPVWPRINVLGLLPCPYTSQRTTSVPPVLLRI